MNDAELFTRLFYYGTAQLHLASEEVWLMPFGFLMDLWSAISSLWALLNLSVKRILTRLCLWGFD